MAHLYLLAVVWVLMEGAREGVNVLKLCCDWRRHKQPVDRVILASLFRMRQIFEGKHFWRRKYAALSALQIFPNKILTYIICVLSFKHQLELAHLKMMTYVKSEGLNSRNMWNVKSLYWLYLHNSSGWFLINWTHWRCKHDNEFYRISVYFRYPAVRIRVAENSSMTHSSWYVCGRDYFLPNFCQRLSKSQRQSNHWLPDFVA
jgi:hypothetical protein